MEIKEARYTRHDQDLEADVVPSDAKSGYFTVSGEEDSRPVDVDTDKLTVAGLGDELSRTGLVKGEQTLDAYLPPVEGDSEAFDVAEGTTLRFVDRAGNRHEITGPATVREFGATALQAA